MKSNNASGPPIGAGLRDLPAGRIGKQDRRRRSPGQETDSAAQGRNAAVKPEGTKTLPGEDERSEEHDRAHRPGRQRRDVLGLHTLARDDRHDDPPQDRQPEPHGSRQGHRRKDMGPQRTRAPLEPPRHQRRAEGERDRQQPSSQVPRRRREIGRDRAQGERRADGVECLVPEGGRQLRDRREERERDPEGEDVRHGVSWHGWEVLPRQARRCQPQQQEQSRTLDEGVEDTRREGADGRVRDDVAEPRLRHEAERRRHVHGQCQLDRAVGWHAVPAIDALDDASVAALDRDRRRARTRRDHDVIGDADLEMTAIAEGRKAIGEAQRHHRTVREAVRVRDEVREGIDDRDRRSLADLHIRLAGARLADQATAARRGRETVTPSHEIQETERVKTPLSKVLELRAARIEDDRLGPRDIGPVDPVGDGHLGQVVWRLGQVAPAQCLEVEGLGEAAHSPGVVDGLQRDGLIARVRPELDGRPAASDVASAAVAQDRRATRKDPGAWHRADDDGVRIARQHSLHSEDPRSRYRVRRSGDGLVSASATGLSAAPYRTSIRTRCGPTSGSGKRRP